MTLCSMPVMANATAFPSFTITVNDVSAVPPALNLRGADYMRAYA